MDTIIQSIDSLAGIIIIALIGITNLALEYRRDLLMMQQNSYRPERYMKWLHTSGDTTSTVRILSYACVLAQISSTAAIRTAGIVGFCIIGLINIRKLLHARYKKPLVWTPRAHRIYATIWLMTAIATVITLYIIPVAHLVIAFIVTISYSASHILMIDSIYILKPLESAINRRYYNEAADILSSMPDLKVIGITGSYGKTSTKHYLDRILSEQYNVLITPGSYNTLMGVIRTIREMMKPYTEVFICEMGAKNIGDIKEICDLVNPQTGIITAVGEQHLESFKTIENVQRTKFELADALPSDGTIYVNADFPYAASRKTNNCGVIYYSTHNESDASWRVTDIKITPDGTLFTLDTPSGSYNFSTRLLGEFNISNLIPAIAVAHSLGMRMDTIARAVTDIRPVEHRLSTKRTPNGITILDDAFNSNPDGSRMALEVLSKMTDGKRIVITPGMIELGERQQELNEQFGRYIAKSVDYAIVVGKYNREAILSGINESGALDKNQIFTPDTFAEAQAILMKIASKGDTVLYENDLPDTFK